MTTTAYPVGPAQRARLDHALRRARTNAYEPGEFVGQESFMRAGDILELALAAGIAPGVRVLDLCCGVGGPGRFLTRQLGCRYTGVDADPAAVAVAGARTQQLGCRFVVSRVPPLPDGTFEVVLLLETMLAFPDKQLLLDDVSGALEPGGRFAFTVEEGQPLTPAEREAMPAPDTVWPVPLPELVAHLERAGLRVSWHRDLSRAHAAVAGSLLEAFTADAGAIQAQVGSHTLDDLISSHRLWSQWLAGGRVRKLAIIAERADAAGDTDAP